MKIAIILVNWNQAKITIRCVESLLQNTRTESTFTYRVIIVDNNSQEESIRLLEHYLATKNSTTPIHLIKNNRNAGFAGGNNVGIRYAMEHHQSNYIWLLNNDIIVQQEALNRLVEAASRYPNPKIWAGTIYELAPSPHFHCAGGFRYNAFLSIPSPVTFPKDQTIPQGLHFSLPEMDYPAGASMFIRTDTFQKHGLLNESYFLYYEELDFVRQIGGKTELAWCPDCILHHQAGKSTGSQNPNKGQGSWIAHYYGNLSALKYTWSYHKLYFPVVFIFRFVSKSILFIGYGDLNSLRPLIKAYIDFFKWLINPKTPMPVPKS